MDWGEWVAAALAFAAAGVAVWQAYEARRARDEAKRSADAAEDANAHARRAADAAERSARADEQLAELAQLDASKKSAPWKIERVSNYRYRLINYSDNLLTNVVLVLNGESPTFADPGDSSTYAAGTSRLLHYEPSIAEPDHPSLVVAWDWPDGLRDKWSSSL